MQTTSDLYQTILADPGHRKEVKLDIAGAEYNEDRIISVRTSGGLFAAPGIGNTCAREIDMEILPMEDIPRQARILAYVRLVLGESVSEWLPKGEFFFSTRQQDPDSGVMTVHGFDAMLKAEQAFLDILDGTEDFPMSPATAVALMAAAMDVFVDSRTELSEDFPVQYPVDEEGDMTIREVLGRLAVANAGNWIISDTGGLLLVPLNSMPVSETGYLVTETGRYITFGGYRIRV